MRREEYPYLYETHMHTAESSKCAKSTGVEMAEACKKAGYAGIIITDHSWHGNHCIDNGLSWEQWVKEFCKGYENARKWGEKHQLDVFFGYEACYEGTEFLIYGVDKEWLISHSEIRDASIEEQYQMIHAAGGCVIQAHPFRKEDYIPKVRLFPDFSDGVEGINATHSCHLSRHHNNPDWDRQGIQYAGEHQLPITAGSDVHDTLIFGGGVAFKRKLTSAADYGKAICQGEDYLLTNGDIWFDKYGRKLEED